MAKELDLIESEVMALGPVDRAALAERLVESLARPDNTKNQSAWLDVARKRREEIRAGLVKGIPGDEGTALVRNLVGG